MREVLGKRAGEAEERARVAVQRDWEGVGERREGERERA